MQYLIYSVDEPALVVISINSQGEPQLSNDESQAMRFTEEEAEAFINYTIDPVGSQFWGTRPVRKPK